MQAFHLAVADGVFHRVASAVSRRRAKVTQIWIFRSRHISRKSARLTSTYSAIGATDVHAVRTGGLRASAQPVVRRPRWLVRPRPPVEQCGRGGPRTSAARCPEARVGAAAARCGHCRDAGRERFRPCQCCGRPVSSPIWRERCQRGSFRPGSRQPIPAGLDRPLWRIPGGCCPDRTE